MKTKCIIVDDEPLAINVVKNHLKSFKDIEIIAECNNALDAGNVLRNNKIDLIFLDIEMPKVSGFDFLSTISKDLNVIIITAYRNYALKSYEFDVIDYLLKPVSFERFYQAVSKYYKTRTPNTESDETPTNQLERDSYIFVYEDKTTHRINIKNINYIESFREYIKIHTDSKSVTTKIPIGQMEQKLKNFNFIRIHKSYIVPVKKVTSFNVRFVTVNNKELPIGRTYKQNVVSVLGDSSML